MADTNPIDVEKTLGGVDFPADKGAIVQKARENGAEDHEINALEDLPEREYSDAADVAEALAGEDESEETDDTEDSDTDKKIEIMDEESDSGQ